MNFFKKNISARIGAGIVMIVLIAWAPWWLIVAGALAFLFIYSPYYEIILWGVIIDALYNPSSGSGLFALIHGATLLAIVLFFCMLFLKKRLAF